MLSLGFLCSLLVSHLLAHSENEISMDSLAICMQREQFWRRLTGPKDKGYDVDPPGGDLFLSYNSFVSAQAILELEKLSASPYYPLAHWQLC